MAASRPQYQFSDNFSFMREKDKAAVLGSPSGDPSGVHG
jgi:hypothetical protein